MTLSGGGTVSMSGGDSLITDNGSGFTLTNVNDKIVGTGVLGAELCLSPKQSGWPGSSMATAQRASCSWTLCD